MTVLLAFALLLSNFWGGAYALTTEDAESTRAASVSGVLNAQDGTDTDEAKTDDNTDADSSADPVLDADIESDHTENDTETPDEEEGVFVVPKDNEDNNEDNKEKTDDGSEESTSKLQLTTLNVTSDDKDNAYDISVTGNLPEDAELVVVPIDTEKAQEMADAAPKTKIEDYDEAELRDRIDEIKTAEGAGDSAAEKKSESAKKPVQKTDKKTDEKNNVENSGRTGILGGSEVGWSYEIAIYCNGERYQPADDGEEVVVTIRDTEAEEIYHINKDHLDENGELDENELSRTASEIEAGYVEVETLPFTVDEKTTYDSDARSGQPDPDEGSITDKTKEAETEAIGTDISFIMDSFSIVQSGTINSVTWELDDQGVLTFRPTNGTSGTLPSRSSPANVNINNEVRANWPYLNYATSIRSVVFEPGIKTGNEARHMFNGCTNLVSIDFTGVDMSTTTVMNDMFRNCTSLKTVNFGRTETQKSGTISQIARAFYGCVALEEVNLDWYTLNISDGNAPNITYNNGNDLFGGATGSKANAVKKLSLKHATLNANTTKLLFKNRANLQSVDLTGAIFGTGVDASSINGMFTGTQLKELNLSETEFINSASNLLSGILNGASGIETLNLYKLNLASGSETLDISSLTNLKTLDLRRSDVSVTSLPNTSVETWKFVSESGEKETLTSTEIAQRIADNGGKLPPGVYLSDDQEWPEILPDGVVAMGTIDGGLEWRLDDGGNLTIRPVDGVSATITSDFADETDWPWHAYRDQIKNVEMLQGTVTSRGTNVSGMFANCPNLTSINLKSWDASSVTNMNDMFRGTGILAFDISTVFKEPPAEPEEMDGTFKDCVSLRNVNLTGLDMSNVTSASDLLDGGKIETLTLSEAELSKAAVGGIFADVSNLKNLDMSGASLAPDVDNVTGILATALSLETVNISGLTNTAAQAIQLDDIPVGAKIITDGSAYVQTMTRGTWSVDDGSGAVIEEQTFEDINNTYIQSGKLASGTYTKTASGPYNISGTMGEVTWEFTGDGVLKIYPTNGVSGTLTYNPAASDDGAENKARWPWDEYRKEIKSIDMSIGTVTAGGAELRSMFMDCISLKSVNLSSFDISNVNNLNDMFRGCSSLEDISLNFKNGSDAGVTQFKRIFQDCSSLKSVDFCELGTANAESTDFVKGCGALEIIDISNIQFYNDVVDFSANELKNLREIILEPVNDSSHLTVKFRTQNGTGVDTWMLGEDKYTKEATLHAGTIGRLIKTANVVPGLDEFQDTYYVVDDLSMFTLKVYDKSINAYREITNWDYVDGQYVLNNSKIPPNGESWMDTDATDSYRIRNEDGHIEIYTLPKTKSDWATGPELQAGIEHSYDMYRDNPDIIVEYKDAVVDKNGVRHDMVVNIDQFRIYNSNLVNVGDDTMIRRSVLAIGQSENDNGQLRQKLTFRNYVLQDGIDKDTPRSGNWKRGTDRGGTGNNGSGTWTDVGFKVSSDKVNPEQTVLFTIGDLDNGSPGRTASGSQKHEIGGEGIIFSEGFRQDTLAVADDTKLKYWKTDGVNFYDGTNDNNTGVLFSDPEYYNPNAEYYYITGNQSDLNPTDTRGRFYIAADASGAGFTWTSGWNCDTDFFETNASADVWDGMPAVDIIPVAEKILSGGETPLEAGQFKFIIEPDDSISLADGNLAQNPQAPLHNGGEAYNTADGSIVFPRMVFAISEDRQYVPVGEHYYVFYEEKGTDKSIAYDQTIHRLRVKVDPAETIVEGRTLGYTVNVYVDGSEESILTTHSTMKVTYGDAMATSNEVRRPPFREQEWSDGEYKYVYDENTDKWNQIRISDGVIVGTVDDPPGSATSDMTLNYAQATTMAHANPNDRVNNTTIKQKAWIEPGDTVEQYKYYDSNNPKTVPLDYSNRKLLDPPMTDGEARTKVWLDGTSRYSYRKVPMYHRYATYEGIKTDKVWTDSDGNQYKYENKEDVMTLREAESVHTRDSGRIRAVEWTDPDNQNKKYVYSNSYRMTYQDDPDKNGEHTYRKDGANGSYATYRKMEAGTSVTLGDAVTAAGSETALFSEENAPDHFYARELTESQVVTDYNTSDYIDSPILESKSTPNHARITHGVRNKYQSNGVYYDPDIGYMVRWTDISQGKFEIIYNQNKYGTGRTGFIKSKIETSGIRIDGYDWYYRNDDSYTADSSSGYNLSNFTKKTTHPGNVHLDDDGTLYVGFYDNKYTQILVVKCTMEGFTDTWKTIVSGATAFFINTQLATETGNAKTDYLAYEAADRISGSTVSDYSWTGDAKLARLSKIENTYQYVYYAPYKVGGEIQYQNGQMLYEKYSYQNNTSTPYNTIADAAGDTKVPQGTMTLAQINAQIEYGAPYVDNMFIVTKYDSSGAVTGHAYVKSPPDDAYRNAAGNSWTYYIDDPDARYPISYSDIPKNATSTLWTGNSVWNKYDSSGTFVEEVTEPPGMSYITEGERWAWARSDDGGSTWVEVSSPTPRSKPEGDNRKVIIREWWVKEEQASPNDYLYAVDRPTNYSEAVFNLTYEDTSYEISDGVDNSYIKDLTWVDEDDFTYTWDKSAGEWVQKNPFGDEVSRGGGLEPPDNAVATLWEGDEFTIAPTGVQFKNRVTQYLRISKKVDTVQADKGGKFTFTVRLTHTDDPGSYKNASLTVIDQNNEESVIRTDSDGSFEIELADGETITIYGLSLGDGKTGYSITETVDFNKYTTAVGISGDTNFMPVSTDETAGKDNAKVTIADTSLTQSSTVTYTNKVIPGELTVKKETADSADSTFGFRVKFSHGFKPDPSKFTLVNANTNTYHFALSKNQQITIPDIPAGVEYEVWEELTDGQSHFGWMLTKVDDNENRVKATGTIESGDEKEHKFLNTKVYRGLQVSKHVTGNMGDKTQKFNFTLALEYNGSTYQIPQADRPSGVTEVNTNGVYTYTFSLSDGESVIFGDLPRTAAYRVWEDDYTGMGYTTRSGETVSGTTTDSNEMTGVIDKNATTCVFINNRTGDVPTGLGTKAKYWVWLLVIALIAAEAWMIVSIKKKRQEKEDNI